MWPNHCTMTSTPPAISTVPWYISFQLVVCTPWYIILIYCNQHRARLVPFVHYFRPTRWRYGIPPPPARLDSIVEQKGRDQRHYLGEVWSITSHQHHEPKTFGRNRFLLRGGGGTVQRHIKGEGYGRCYLDSTVPYNGTFLKACPALLERSVSAVCWHGRANTERRLLIVCP